MNNERENNRRKKERVRSEYPSEGLEGMMEYGRRVIDAQYSVSTKVSLLQEDILDIAEGCGNSIETIVQRAFGEVRGIDAFAGRSRAILASEAISHIIGVPLSVVIRVVEISIDEPYGDTFEIAHIHGEATFSAETLEALRDSALISDAHFGVLTDEYLTGFSSSFKKGDLVTNASADPDARPSSHRICSYVRERLPPGIPVAKVTRIDFDDGSIRWQCVSDPSKYGWVSIKGIRHYFSSAPKGQVDDDRSRFGDWM